MSVETVRPAGAGHETLYVLLGSVLILALAATVVGLRQQSHEAQALDAHQVDARLGPAEVWLKPAAAAAGAVPGDARALADAGWRQVVSRFDAGVTRQHRH